MALFHCSIPKILADGLMRVLGKCENDSLPRVELTEGAKVDFGTLQFTVEVFCSNENEIMITLSVSYAGRGERRGAYGQHRLLDRALAPHPEARGPHVLQAVAAAGCLGMLLPGEKVDITFVALVSSAAAYAPVRGKLVLIEICDCVVCMYDYLNILFGFRAFAAPQRPAPVPTVPQTVPV